MTSQPENEPIVVAEDEDEVFLVADATNENDAELVEQTVFPEDEDFGEVSQEPVDLHPTEEKA